MEAAIVAQQGRKGKGRDSSEAGGAGGNRGRDRRALWTPQTKRWRKGMSGDQKPVCMRRKNAEKIWAYGPKPNAQYSSSILQQAHKGVYNGGLQPETLADGSCGSDGASEAGLIQKANAPSVTLGKKSLNLSRVFNWLSSQKRAFSQDA
eukprot:1157535-Pelagomonas_calceolata.AAC.3